jgi:hypothetical protein
MLVGAGSALLRKLCPFMSDKTSKILCEQNECMAWEPETEYCLIHATCPECDGSKCDLDSCKKSMRAVLNKGFCHLIKNGVRP